MAEALTLAAKNVQHWKFCEFPILYNSEQTRDRQTYMGCTPWWVSWGN